VWGSPQSGQVTGPPTHLPLLHVSSAEQGDPSLHGPVLFTWKHPVDGLQSSSVQTLLSAHAVGPPGAHFPSWQVSPEVHALASLHDDPFGFVGSEHVPVVGSHVPGEWHWSLAGQVTEFEPVHVPDWHVSVLVHALPSLQPIPLGLAGLEQMPVAALQIPALWHWSLAVHTTGFDPVHAPDWHVSVCVQAFPSLHAAPLGFAGFVHTPVDVLHVPAR
jgi:hypothetical protein